MVPLNDKFPIDWMNNVTSCKTMGTAKNCNSLVNVRPWGHLIVNYNKEGPAPESARSDPIFIHIDIFCMVVRFSILPFDVKTVTNA